MRSASSWGLSATQLFLRVRACSVPAGVIRLSRREEGAGGTRRPAHSFEARKWRPLLCSRFCAYPPCVADCPVPPTGVLSQERERERANGAGSLGVVQLRCFARVALYRCSAVVWKGGAVLPLPPTRKVPGTKTRSIGVERPGFDQTLAEQDRCGPCAPSAGRLFFL